MLIKASSTHSILKRRNASAAWSSGSLNKFQVRYEDGVTVLGQQSTSSFHFFLVLPYFTLTSESLGSSRYKVVVAFVEFVVLHRVVLLAALEQIIIFFICSQVRNMSSLLI